MTIFFLASSVVYFSLMLRSLRDLSFWSLMRSRSAFWWFSWSLIFFPSSNLRVKWRMDILVSLGLPPEFLVHRDLLSEFVSVLFDHLFLLVVEFEFLLPLEFLLLDDSLELVSFLTCLDGLIDMNGLLILLIAPASPWVVFLCLRWVPCSSCTTKMSKI